MPRSRQGGARRRDLHVFLTGLAVPCVVVALATALRRGVAPLFAWPTLRADRLVAVLVVAALGAAAVPFRRALRAAVTDFFAETAHPVNLAVFRIAVFLALSASFSVARTVWFSELPRALMFPPTGAGFVFRVLPVDPVSATIASVLLRVVCVTAAVGLASRLSAAVAAVLAVYVLGIPQLYGKVVHIHHLVWFAALLAASPCGDALSLDALLGRQGRTRSADRAPRPARVYALPLGFAWLLIGVAYFFPGLWKAVGSGLDWALSDNLGALTTLARLRGHGATLPWRLDLHPGLYETGALATLLFEPSFIVLVFSPRLRWLALAAALVFHGLTALFLGIAFWSFQVCLLALVDWRRLFTAASGRGGPTEDAGVATPADVAAPRASDVRATVVVGSLLVTVNALFGVLGVVAAWPFACYPAFAHVAAAETRRIAFTIASADGSTRDVCPTTEPALTRHFAAARLVDLEPRLLGVENATARHERLRAYWAMWTRVDPRARDAREVRVYVDTLTTVPERAGENPLGHQLIDTLTLP